MTSSVKTNIMSCIRIQSVVTRLILAVIIAAPWAVSSSSAQGKLSRPGTATHLKLRAAVEALGDSVVIRWAPATAMAWELCNDSGYQLLRIDYSTPGAPVTTHLTKGPLRPMTLAEMKASLAPANKYAAIASQAMYGGDFRMTQAAPATFSDQVRQAHNALDMRYSLAMQSADFSPPVASALALRWVDRNVKQGGRYLYVVYSTAANGNYIIDSARAAVVNIRSTRHPAPQGLKAFGFDRSVELHWNRRQSGQFDAYYVERSDDGGKTYHRLDSLAFFSSYNPAPAAEHGKTDTAVHEIASILRDHQVYFDSIPRDYHTYYYRVTGINAFGEQSPFSDPVAVSGRDMTPPSSPVIETVSTGDARSLALHWRQPAPAADVAGYYVSRAGDVKGPFVPLTTRLLGKNTFRFIDTAAIPHGPNYYAVLAVDTAGNVSASTPRVGYLEDTVAPAAPTGVGGYVDSSGVVHLHWHPGPEPDLEGYKVYYAYNPDQSYSQITHTAITDTSFSDTISMTTLYRRVYYEVVAVDFDDNHSPYSAAAVLSKPYVIAPAAPVAGSVYGDAGGAHIQWFESRSPGVKGYTVYRSRKGESWQPVDTLAQDWTREDILYTDTAISPNTDYYYAASTLDSTGVSSPRSFTVRVRYSRAATLPSADGLRAAWDSSSHAVKLDWNYNGTGDYFFVLYRSSGTGPLAPWHSSDQNARSWGDKEVSSGVYHYAIRVVSRQRHARSAVSEPVTVRVVKPSL
jgi:hypothetical protein